jgi:hypothetical protein
MFSQIYSKPAMDPIFRYQNFSDPDLAAMFLQVHRAFEVAGLSDLEKESALLMLSTELVGRHASPSPPVNPVKAEKMVVKKAKRYLEDRRQENISPEMLAAALEIRFKGSTLEIALELIGQVDS